MMSQAPISVENYSAQTAIWPASGRHILAHFDADSVVVYQAYAPRIADFAMGNGRFGGDFSYNRMSWVKPNFLWMNYRSGWNSKENQEKTLAVRLELGFWEEVLAVAVPSSFDAAHYETVEAWQSALAASEVRLQWDPDYGPRGEKLERRAIQLGLRGEVLRRYGTQALSIEDATPLVLAGRECIERGEIERLKTPRERVYSPLSAETAARLGLAAAI